MPVYTVHLRVNVPSVGERPVVIPNVIADSLAQAITAAIAQIKIEPTAVQKTAD